MTTVHKIVYLRQACDRHGVCSDVQTLILSFCFQRQEVMKRKIKTYFTGQVLYMFKDAEYTHDEHGCWYLECFRSTLSMDSAPPYFLFFDLSAKTLCGQNCTRCGEFTGFDSLMTRPCQC
jgi:hypothetical protein